MIIICYGEILMPKIKDNIIRVFNRIFRRNSFPMLANVSKQNYDEYQPFHAMAPIVLSILMISGIATLSAHMLPASSTDEATALCDESRHSSEASFVTIAIAAHFMTGAMNSSPELVMLFISSASSRRGAVKHIETAAAAPSTAESSGLLFFMTRHISPAAIPTAEAFIRSSIVYNPNRLFIIVKSSLIFCTTIISTTTSAVIVVISACSSRPERWSRIFSTATRMPTAAILKMRSTSIPILHAVLSRKKCYISTIRTRIPAAADKPSTSLRRSGYCV